MKQPLKVVIYGDTLLLGCLRASLASHACLELVSVEAHATGKQVLADLHPNVILFDLSAGEPAFLYAIATRPPGPLLVGVDSASNRVVTWRGQQLCRLSMAELVQAITADGGDCHSVGDDDAGAPTAMVRRAQGGDGA
jgi:hypothetical protein